MSKDSIAESVRTLKSIDKSDLTIRILGILIFPNTNSIFLDLSVAINYIFVGITFLIVYSLFYDVLAV